MSVSPGLSRTVAALQGRWFAGRDGIGFWCPAPPADEDAQEVARAWHSALAAGTRNMGVMVGDGMWVGSAWVAAVDGLSVGGAESRLRAYAAVVEWMPPVDVGMPVTPFAVLQTVDMLGVGDWLTVHPLTAAGKTR